MTEKCKETKMERSTKEHSLESEPRMHEKEICWHDDDDAFVQLLSLWHSAKQQKSSAVWMQRHFLREVAEQLLLAEVLANKISNDAKNKCDFYEAQSTFARRLTRVTSALSFFTAGLKTFLH